MKEGAVAKKEGSCGCRGNERVVKAGGLGWVSAPKAMSHDECDLTSPARLGSNLRLSGLTAAQTA
eukprot:CAMPEP_0174323880 /NCGR_PEP_ID=MMETSP0810-20121108/12112_1 /TAXON_ID=73025 ORGANISM="Eutreptiella gymnastica-like, Strain CCMP1594" /NCGR_SAMPLE_ID=MMETSP0810 /ASSEMBLY_ACC=CAM_ASM_000659 /LENGTH=64 /DNA_ID=CAMNT_0015436475 /DNA_START=106 /DNA_END=296 /DNA_ORIENTATION=-